MRKFATLCFLGAVAAHASALNLTGPFVGAHSEDFEGFPNYHNVGGQSSMFTLMGGFATVTATSGAPTMYVYEPALAGWGLGAYGGATVHGGTKGFGLYEFSYTNQFILEFNSPVDSVGAYFGTCDISYGPFNLDFYDGANNLLGSDSFVTPSAVQVWHGWADAAGIKKVVMFGNQAPSFDDLQAQAVPEPASLFAIGAGAVAFARRRRR